MGGNALKKYGIITERKNTEEYNQIGHTLQQHIHADLGLTTSVVKSYRNKMSHGDLDLLIKIDGSARANG